MWNLIASGGLVFTGPLLILLLTIIGLGLVLAKAASSDDAARQKRLLLHLGLFSAVFGFLGQAMGLYQAMSLIESVGSISPTMLAGGLKVSFIAPIFGLLNLAVALVLYMWMRYKGDLR